MKVIVFRVKLEDPSNIFFEIHLKILIDLLYLFLGVGFGEEVLTKKNSIDLLKRIENINLKLLSFSLDVPFIPMKKAVFLLKLYFEIIFEEITQKNKENILTKQHLEELYWETPRVWEKNKNPIESFYVNKFI